MADIIQLRRATAANWTATNPVLADGEQGLETDSRKIKTGNGVDTWTILPYDAGSTGGIPDAPNDGKQYARQSLGWSEVVATGGGDLSDYQTTAQADAKYQVKGNYLTSASLNDYQTTTTADGKYQPKGTYLTDAPNDTNAYNRKGGAWVLASSGGTDSRVDDLLINQISITTSANITTNTVGSTTGKGQHGRNVKIKNSTTPIDVVCETTSHAEFIASYSKIGDGAITFKAGSGATLIVLDGTAILNGAVGSTASLTRDGNIFYLQISNR